MTLFEVLEATAARHGSRPAVTEVSSGRTLSYADLLAAATRVGDRMRAHGVAAGQRIALVAGNGLWHVPVAFGIAATGACIVPIAPTLRAAEVEAVLAETDVHAVLAVGDDVEALALRRRDVGICAPEDLARLAPAFIRFTSGTTAASKGVILSTTDVLARVRAADAVLALGPADVVLWTLPLAYHFAVTIVGYVRAGAHVLLAGDTLPAALVEAAVAHRATVLYGAPLQFERMASAGRRQRLDAVRVALSTAAPLRAEIADAFEATCGVPLGQAYGIIEAGLPCINTRTAGEPPTSVGLPAPGYEVSVVDERGTPLGPGVAGHVRVRGEGLFSGYYRPWQPRAAVLVDGWFATGDVGVLDDAGRLSLVGRSTSVIIVAGMKVFPEEVEAALDAMPGVAESRVFGRPHARLGEVPCAEVVPRGDGPRPEPRALAAACAQALSSHKVPVEIRVVSALPRTAGGKLLRR
jgi:acyl-coenzyme A synthetase/AMP-(fatty) acid ligase